MVGIKDFKFPRNCAECRFKRFNEGVDEWFCAATLKTLSDGDTWGYESGILDEYRTNRHPDCPLIEVSEPEIVFYGDNRPMTKLKKEYPDVKEDQDAED